MTDVVKPSNNIRECTPPLVKKMCDNKSMCTFLSIFIRVWVIKPTKFCLINSLSISPDMLNYNANLSTFSAYTMLILCEEEYENC